MNFFQMPNSLWDREDLDIYERGVLVHIIRKTIGWGKVKDGISLNQFVKILKISKPKIIESINKLVEKGIITKESRFLENGSQSYNVYGLNPEIIERANNEGVNDIDRGGKCGLQGGVNDIDTQYTSNTKNTNTKNTNEFFNTKPKQEEQSPISLLSKKINDVLQNEGINLTPDKVMLFDRKLVKLNKAYSLKDIEETFMFGLEDKFYSKIVVNPNSFFNNFESIRMKYKEQEDNESQIYNSSNLPLRKGEML